MTFQRARSDEQRAERRQAILGTAADMLAEMPVADLSLNELSRRVGLAKSNVLRYFESREAVLLELMADAWTRFVADLNAGVGDAPWTGPQPERTVRLVELIAGRLVKDPLLCELMSTSAAVLERNISTDLAHSVKSSALANTRTLASLGHRCFPELSEEGAHNFAVMAAVCASGLWPHAHPSDALLDAYRDPELAPMKLDFAIGLSEMLKTVLAGCLSRWPA